MRETVSPDGNPPDKDILVEQYLTNGFTLLKLAGKKPVDNDWSNTRYDPMLGPEDFPRNYGVLLGANHVIIDVDPRKFDDDKDPLLALMDVIPGLWEAAETTYTVQTGGEFPGLHIYFTKPEDVKTREILKEYPGLEFKTKGRQVVGPGSIHPDTGNAYKVLRGNPGDIQELPAELLDLIRRTDDFDLGDGLGEFKDDEGTRGLFIQFLKNAPAAIQGDQGDLTTYKTACVGKDYGLPPEAVFDLMLEHWNERCSPPWGPEEMAVKVKSAYSTGKQAKGVLHPEYQFKKTDITAETVKEAEQLETYLDWDLHSKTERPFPTLRNTVNFFKDPESPLYQLLRYNEFSDRIEFNSKAPWHKREEQNLEWTDTDGVMLKKWLSSYREFEIPVTLCHEAAIYVARRVGGSYHPIRNYLNSLEWDGTPRLDTLLSKYAGSPDNPYTANCGKNVLIAAVARVFNPGCQFDHILILEGRQGSGKSSFCRILGGEWYADVMIDPHSKDTVDALGGKWIIEASEMEAYRRADIQAFKSFITKTTDRVRPAYARNSQDFPRQSVFIGTINPDADKGYLKDTTGNRRFWPIATGRIHLDALQRDRDQLWAEAVYRYKQGEDHYFTDPALILLAEAEQASRMSVDPWVELVHLWEASNRAKNTLPLVVTTTLVAQEALNLSPRSIGRVESGRIAHALQELGWEKGRYYVPSLRATAWGYRQPLDYSDLDGI